MIFPSECLRNSEQRGCHVTTITNVAQIELTSRRSRIWAAGKLPNIQPFLSPTIKKPEEFSNFYWNIKLFSQHFKFKQIQLTEQFEQV